jgi:hypothetical protein
MGQAKIMRGILRRWFTGLERPWMDGDKAAGEIMGLLDQAGWAPPEAAHKLYPLTRPGNTVESYYAKPAVNGGEALSEGDTVELVIGGELVRGTFVLCPNGAAAVNLTVELDKIAVEHRLADSLVVCGADHWPLPLPDCVLLRKVD